MQVDEDEHYLMSREELYNKIVTLTGGQAAEQLVFHSITTGASNDIEKATRLARGMITRYGMGGFGMVALETQNSQYLGQDTPGRKQTVFCGNTKINSMNWQHTF